jgi:hypothetical protein
VVYKGQYIYESWCSGGPDKAVYTSSLSRWFDMCIGEDWCKKIFLPHVRRQPGRKLLIGVNLASHISMEVIRLCKENNILLLCLPPNSTEKMQPLCGHLWAMKSAWRKQVLSYAEKDPAAKVLQKTEFPCRRLQFYTFFGTSIGITRRMIDIGKKKLFNFCKMFENVQFFSHLHFKIAKSAITV